MESRAETMPCQVRVNGRPCRAAPMRGAGYCIAHRHHRLGVASVSLAALSKLAEEFDERSREASQLYSAAEFVSWLKPELDGQD